MAPQFVCPRGHQWGVGDVDALDNPRAPSLCPVCRAPAVAAPSEAAAAPHPRTEAFVPKPSLSPGRALPGPATLPPTGPTSQDESVELPTIPGFEMMGILGRGGMGVVYWAWQSELNRTVALKMVLAGAHAGSQELARFRTEAEAVGRLQHTHIVQIYSVGRHEDHPYLVLEYVEGGSLAQQLTGTPFPARRAAALVETLAQAMHYAHQQGIVHRDLTPGNILLTDDGRPKITDFGLAKLLVGGGAVRTQSGAIVGTPSYMAPEQAAGKTKEIGPAADVYGLGAILYELLTGRPPFRAETPLETLLQVQADEPVPPSRLQPKLARDLGTICLKALAKEPSKRYPTAAGLADDLRRWLQGEPIQARPVGFWERGARWARHRPALTALVALSCLAVLSLWAGVLWHTAHLRRAMQLAEDERHQAVTHLYHALVGEARALRRARTEGYRQQAWQLLHQALRLKTPDNDPLQLREEAAACLGDFVGLEPTTWTDLPEALASVAFHPDGAQVALSLADGTVWLRDVTNGADLGRLKGYAYSSKEQLLDPPDWFRGALQTVPERLTLGQPLAFAPDGSSLLTVAVDGTIQVWKRNGTGAWTHTKTMPLEPVLVALTPSAGFPFFIPSLTLPQLASIALQPESNRVAALSRYDASVVVSNLGDGTTAARFRVPGAERVWKVALSPDGKLVAGGYVHLGASGDRSYGVFVWQVATGQLQRVLPQLGALHDIVFSPDGKLLACVHAEGVALFDTSTFQPHLFVRGDFPSTLAFSPDAQLVAIQAPQRNAIRLWNIVANREVALLSNPARAYLLRFSPDGNALVASDLRSIRLWNLGGTGEKLVLAGHAGGITSAAFSPHGNLLASAGKDGKVRIWDAGTGTVLKELSDFPGPLQSLAFGLAGRVLAVGDSQAGTIRIYEVGSWQVLAAPPPESAQAILSVHFSPDGKYFVAGGPGGLTLWRVLPGAFSLQRLSRLSERESSRICFSPDGSLLAWKHWDGSSGTVHLWDARTAQTRALPAARVDLMSRVDFYGDGKHLTFVSQARAIEGWEVSTGQRVFSFGAGELERRGALTQAGSHTALSSDGAWYAVARQAITVWDMEGRKLLLALPEERGVVWSLAWSPNKELLAVGTSDGGLVLWNLPKVKAQLTQIGLGW